MNICTMYIVHSSCIDERRLLNIKPEIEHDFEKAMKSYNQMVPSVVSCNIGAEMPSKVCIIIVEVKYYLNWQQI